MQIKSLEEVINRLQYKADNIKAKLEPSYFTECIDYLKSLNGDLISKSALIKALTNVEVSFYLEDGQTSDTYDGTTIMDIIEEQTTISVDDGWIPCSERLPKVETEVLIYARRKYTGGHFKDIITTAMYEDGTVRENDSCWRWEEIEGEWDEEEDCYIIPEGWWENKHYNPDGELNYAVDDKVLAWRELPQPYQPKGD